MIRDYSIANAVVSYHTDPTNIIHHIDTTKVDDLRKVQKFTQVLSDANVDLGELKRYTEYPVFLILSFCLQRHYGN